MLERSSHLAAIKKAFKTHPVVAILGPRQVGKTTLARRFAATQRGQVQHFDLEDPADLARLAEPRLALGKLSGLVILDEIQRTPGVFPILRVLVDDPKAKRRFLVLGSASPELLRQSSETLAGRIAYHELPPITLDELETNGLDRLWLRGGFPRSLFARTDTQSHEWRSGFIRTFLERDLPQLGLKLPAPQLRRFWTMVAHYHGQIWNAAEVAGSMGFSDATARRYLDFLTATFMVHPLAPWSENLGKRQVKSPKIYLADSGILHALLGLRDQASLEANPKLGASWEGFLLSQLIARLGAEREECFFWATHQGAELDFLVVRGNKRLGFEFKRTSSPSVTKSMRIAMHDLKLDHLTVLHAGDHSFPLDHQIDAVAAHDIIEHIRPL
jgi:predicted AAA+ superfamily ATPase